MQSPFDIYSRVLARRRLAPSSRDRYGQVLRGYRLWLGGREPAPQAAGDYLAELRERGYQDTSLDLYYQVLRGFHKHLGHLLDLGYRRARRLPQYHPQSHTDRFLTEAERGLDPWSPSTRARSYAVAVVLAYTGIRRGELLNLRVGDIDFETRMLRVRQGKGRKDRTIPLHERTIVPLRGQCKGRSATARWRLAA